MQAVRQAEYIWLDGATPTQRLRSKTRIVAFPENEPVTLAALRSACSGPRSIPPR
jgi:hypothetical protein